MAKKVTAEIRLQIPPAQPIRPPQWDPRLARLA